MMQSSRRCPPSSRVESGVQARPQAPSPSTLTARVQRDAQESHHSCIGTPILGGDLTPDSQWGGVCKSGHKQTQLWGSGKPESGETRPSRQASHGERCFRGTCWKYTPLFIKPHSGHKPHQGVLVSPSHILPEGDAAPAPPRPLLLVNFLCG